MQFDSEIICISQRRVIYKRGRYKENKRSHNKCDLVIGYSKKMEDKMFNRHAGKDAIVILIFVITRALYSDSRAKLIARNGRGRDLSIRALDIYIKNIFKT